MIECNIHDNILAAVVALKLVISVSSSIGSNVSQLVSYKDLQCCTMLKQTIVKYCYNDMVMFQYTTVADYSDQN